MKGSSELLSDIKNDADLKKTAVELTQHENTVHCRLKSSMSPAACCRRKAEAKKILPPAEKTKSLHFQQRKMGALFMDCIPTPKKITEKTYNTRRKGGNRLSSDALLLAIYNIA